MKYLPIIAIVLLSSCGTTRKDTYGDYLEPVLPIQATSPEQQAEDMAWLRDNPLLPR